MPVLALEESFAAFRNPGKGWRRYVFNGEVDPTVGKAPDVSSVVHAAGISLASVYIGPGPSLGGSSDGFDWGPLDAQLAAFPDDRFAVLLNSNGRPDKFGHHPWPYWLREILRDDASGGPSDMGAGFYTKINQPDSLSLLDVSTGPISAGADTLTIAGSISDEGFPSEGYLDFDGEYISYVGTSGDDTFENIGDAPLLGEWGGIPIGNDHPAGMPVATGDGQWEPNYEAIRTGDSEPAVLLAMRDLCDAFAAEYGDNDQVAWFIPGWFGESGEWLSSMSFQRSRFGVYPNLAAGFTPLPTAADPLVFTVHELTVEQLDETGALSAATETGALNPPTVFHDDFSRTVDHQWVPPRTDAGIVVRDPIEGGGYANPEDLADPIPGGADEYDLAVDPTDGGTISLLADGAAKRQVSNFAHVENSRTTMVWSINKIPTDAVTNKPLNVDIFARRRYDPFTLENINTPDPDSPTFASYASRMILKVSGAAARIRHRPVRELAGVTSLLGSEVTVAAINPLLPDHRYHTVIEVFGHRVAGVGATTIRARTWDGDVSDPGAWTNSTDDTTDSILQSVVGDRRYVTTKSYVDAVLDAFGDPPVSPRCVMNALGSLNQGGGTRIDERDNLAIAYAIDQHGFAMTRRSFGGAHPFLPDRLPPDEAAFTDDHVADTPFLGEAGTRGFSWTIGHSREGERPTHEMIDDALARHVNSLGWWTGEETLTASAIPPSLDPVEVPGAEAGVGRKRTTGDFVLDSPDAEIADTTGFTVDSYLSAEEGLEGDWVTFDRTGVGGTAEQRYAKITGIDGTTVTVDGTANVDLSDAAVTRFTAPGATYVEHPFSKLYPGSDLSLTDYFQTHSGYRFFLAEVGLPDSLEAGQSFALGTTWYQRGVAKSYEHYDVRCDLVDEDGTRYTCGVDTSFDAEDWDIGPSGPHTIPLSFDVPAELPVGHNYTLQIALVGEGGEPAVNLANEGKDTTDLADPVNDPSFYSLTSLLGRIIGQRTTGNVFASQRIANRNSWVGDAA